jgi:hypothetical protein
MDKMIERLISSLEKVKRTGQNRFIACCPAHNDKSPSLALEEREGKVLFHCFAGCAPADVLAAVGMEFSDLYPERPSHGKPGQFKFNPYDVLKCLSKEAGIAAIASAQLAAGKSLSPADAVRVTLAHDRLTNAGRLMRIRYE